MATDNPFIADFQFFKSRFQKKQKESKIAVRVFAENLEKLAKYLKKKNDSEDIEKNPGLARKVLARDMIEQTKNIAKGIDELAEILDKLSKSENSQVTAMKFKGQLKDLQTEFSQLKKLFRAQCKSMQLLDQNTTGQNSNGVKNRKIQKLSQENEGLDKTLNLTNEILSSGSEAARSLQGQGERLHGVKGKLDKNSLGQSSKLIDKIGSREKSNNQALGFVIACCLACLVYHYNFFGLKFMTETFVTQSPEESAQSQPVFKAEEEPVLKSHQPSMMSPGNQLKKQRPEIEYIEQPSNIMPNNPVSTKVKQLGTGYQSDFDASKLIEEVEAKNKIYHQEPPEEPDVNEQMMNDQIEDDDRIMQSQGQRKQYKMIGQEGEIESMEAEEENLRPKKIGQQENEIKPKRIEQEEGVENYKEETLKPKKIEQDELQQRIEDEDSLKPKRIEQEESLKPKRIEQEESLKPKRIEQEESLKPHKIEQDEPLKPKRIDYEEDSFQPRRIESLKPKRIDQDEETLKPKKIIQNDEPEIKLKPKRIDEDEDALKPKKIEDILKPKKIIEDAIKPNKLELKPQKFDYESEELKPKKIQAKKIDEDQDLKPRKIDQPTYQVQPLKVKKISDDQVIPDVRQYPQHNSVKIPDVTTSDSDNEPVSKLQRSISDDWNN